MQTDDGPSWGLPACIDVYSKTTEKRPNGTPIGMASSARFYGLIEWMVWHGDRTILLSHRSYGLAEVDHSRQDRCYATICCTHSYGVESTPNDKQRAQAPVRNLVTEGYLPHAVPIVQSREQNQWKRDGRRRNDDQTEPGSSTCTSSDKTSFGEERRFGFG